MSKKITFFATSAALVLLLAACGSDPKASPGEPAGIVSVPLRAPTGGETPRFRLVPPAESGLSFTNVLQPAHTVRRFVPSTI